MSGIEVTGSLVGTGDVSFEGGVELHPEQINKITIRMNIRGILGNFIGRFYFSDNYYNLVNEKLKKKIWVE